MHMDSHNRLQAVTGLYIKVCSGRAVCNALGQDIAIPTALKSLYRNPRETLAGVTAEPYPTNVAGSPLPAMNTPALQHKCLAVGVRAGEQI